MVHDANFSLRLYCTGDNYLTCTPQPQALSQLTCDKHNPRLQMNIAAELETSDHSADNDTYNKRGNLVWFCAMYTVVGGPLHRTGHGQMTRTVQPTHRGRRGGGDFYLTIFRCIRPILQLSTTLQQRSSPHSRLDSIQLSTRTCTPTHPHPHAHNSSCPRG